MKINLYFCHVVSTLLAFFMVTGTPNAMAKTLNLYDQPKADSKVLGSVDSNAGIITIFMPKEGKWVKVADPRNGNVGWIKSADLKQTGFTYKVVTSGDGTHGYQIIQYGNTKPYTAEQVSTIMKSMQKRQQMLQKDMQLMMQDMFAMHHSWMDFPMIVPVIVVPEKAPAPAHHKDKIAAVSAAPQAK